MHTLDGHNAPQCLAPACRRSSVSAPADSDRPCSIRPPSRAAWTWWPTDSRAHIRILGAAPRPFVYLQAIVGIEKKNILGISCWPYSSPIAFRCWPISLTMSRFVWSRFRFSFLGTIMSGATGGDSTPLVGGCSLPFCVFAEWPFVSVTRPSVGMRMTLTVKIS